LRAIGIGFDFDMLFLLPQFSCLPGFFCHKPGRTHRSSAFLRHLTSCRDLQFLLHGWRATRLQLYRTPKRTSVTFRAIARKWRMGSLMNISEFMVSL
jgi:hypothetical protein